MKRVPLNNRPPFNAYDVLLGIIENPSQNQGINYAEIKKRSRMLDAAEKHKHDGYVDFEDGDHEHLVMLLNQFPFATAKRELRLILDDIVNAKPPEKTKQLHAVPGEKD